MPWINEPTLKKGRDGFMNVATVGVWEDPSTKEHHVVPAGTETNLASIPWFLGWYIDKLGDALLPSVLHDHEYVHGNDRKAADLRFYVGLMEDGMRQSKASLAYKVLRLCGWYAWWRGHKR